MNTLNTRQVIILAAFCLPLFGLIGLSYLESGKPGMPKLPPQTRRPPQVTGGPPVPASLAVEREKYKKLLEQAVAMTPEEYLERKKTDPTFEAPDIDTRRARLARRVSQLEHITPQQWNEQQDRLRAAREGAAAVQQPKPATQPAAATQSGQTPVPRKLPPLTP